MLEYKWGGFDMRWELEACGDGTRLTLWTNIGHRFIAMGAAGWHICFDVLDRLLAGQPIGRMVGPDAMKFGGWQRLNAEYARQFGIETPNWPPRRPKVVNRGDRKNNADNQSVEWKKELSAGTTWRTARSIESPF